MCQLLLYAVLHASALATNLIILDYIIKWRTCWHWLMTKSDRTKEASCSTDKVSSHDIVNNKPQPGW